MESHQRKFHPNTKTGYSRALVQSQNHTGQTTYFGVHTAADEAKLAEKEIWLAAKYDVENRRGTIISSDPLIEDDRFQGQLERALRWSKEVKEKDSVGIYNLTCPPNSGTILVPLRSICNGLLGKINASLQTGDRILRGKLIA